MVMTIAACDVKEEMRLSTLGIKDSKLLAPQRRRELVGVIKQHCAHKTLVIGPQEIDEAILDPNSNLNLLEAQATAKLIDALATKLGVENVDKVILDCPSTNIKAYEGLMKRLVKAAVRIVAEHKADYKYAIVAAASIIAKVRRDEEIEKLKKTYNVNIGSGYPGDPITASFVRKYYRDYPFFRKTWATYKEAAAAASQSTLSSFASMPALSSAVEEKKQKLLALREKGLRLVEAKGASEVLRLKGEGVVITLYTTGKVLVQGKDKDSWSRLV